MASQMKLVTCLFAGSHCSKTRLEQHPWWQINLQEIYLVTGVVMAVGKHQCTTTTATEIQTQRFV